MNKQTFYASALKTEQCTGASVTILGQAQSVYDLYRKMVLGNVDAADYVRPVTYDESADIDNPDPLNSSSLTYEEVSTQLQTSRAVVENDRKKKQEEQQAQQAQQAQFQAQQVQQVQ